MKAAEAEVEPEIQVAGTESDGPVVETGIVAEPPVEPVEAKAAAVPKRSAKPRQAKSAAAKA